MFGYVMIDKPELKVREFYRYKAYYCGLCRTLKEVYGFRGRMTLTYDMTFLVLFLTSLYEKDTKELQSHCPLHPVKKIPMLQNEFSEYGAKMNILLAYFNFQDDWKDDKSFSGLTGMRLFRSKAEQICREYPRQAKAVQKQLKLLAACEEKGQEDIDLAAGIFGKLMEELFVYRSDVWEENLRRFGFYLGKFIYIIDAWEDLPKDMKTVECQKEDVAFDMECYTDSQGHTYDFGYGMNFSGVISDVRTCRYTKQDKRKESPDIVS